MSMFIIHHHVSFYVNASIYITWILLKITLIQVGMARSGLCRCPFCLARQYWLHTDDLFLLQLLPFSGIDYVPIRDEQGKYICDVCGETFTSSTSVRRHKINIHHKVRYYCTQCGKSFCQKCHLSSHLRSVHNFAAT